YFFLCLFSSGIHPNLGGVSYYWGQCLLVAWALWPFRSPRFGLVLWIAALAAAVAVGFGSQTGISGFQHFLEGYNAQWIARFLRQRTDPMQSTTSIGQIGSLKLSGRIVIRLHTPTDEAPPTYLREATYRIYHSAKCTWYAGSLRNDFENLSPEHDQTTWVLLRKTNVASVNIACYLNSRNPQTGNPLGLLPLPSGVGQLDNLNAYTLQKNGEAAVLAEGPGLVIFDADYSPGATLDSPPDSSTNQLDLEVPTNEVAALKQIIAGLKISGATEQQKLSAVAGFFAGHFTYSIWQGKDKLATTNESSLSRFLLTSRSGHCEYFATATVLLLRELKIPARYAVGYAVHEPAGSGYVVRERDAHAWCLAWDAATKTWIDFDTTPASWVSQEEKRATFWQHFSDFRSWIAFEIAKLRWGQTNLRQYILIGLTPVLLLLLYQILFRRGQKRRATKESKAPLAPIHWPGLDSEFYLLEQKLARRGLPRQPGESLSLWLERVLQSPDLADLRAPARKLLRLHYRHRFDPRGLNEADREILRREVVARLREPDGDRS
ncbi:MAG TPA: transglutaminase domain-containing protein, partial [Verrucomicrobiae bacterium]|nr:transglutaminase domain-containing protein [Verrucomicrobiae bacterium]